MLDKSMYNVKRRYETKIKTNKQQQQKDQRNETVIFIK